jgi:hypothetical protein
MAIRDRLRANAAKVLKPGETIQAVIPAQTINPLFYAPLALMAVLPLIVIILIAEPFRVVVVTDRRILVCKAGKFRTTEVNEVLEKAPRATALGTPRGLQFKCTALGNENLYVAKRFFADVRQADALRPGA